MSRLDTATGAHRPGVALGALSVGAFVIGCTEFMTVGLLPDIAGSLAVSESAAGQLVTANAAAVVVAAPMLGAMTAGRDLRRVLVAALLAFATAHAVAAAAPSFAVLLLARVVGGAAFGLYLATAFAAATRLTPATGRARALAAVQAGVTTATALGVPTSMVLGQFGWRWPFGVLGGLALAAAVHVVLAVPRVPADPGGGSSVRARLAVLLDGRVAVAIATVAVFWAASLSAFTYLLPILGQRAGLGTGAVLTVLFLAGACSVVGALLGGYGADRALTPTLLATAATTAISLALLALLGWHPAAAVVLVAVWQLAAWSYVPAIQARVHEIGGEAAVAFTVSAFNLGIVAGAGLGGAVLGAAGPVSVPALAAGLAVAATVLTVLAVRGREPVR